MPLRLLFLIAVLAAPLAAPAADGRKRAADPEALYHNYCSVCHGDRGDGRSRARTSLVPPPRDFTDPNARATLTRDWMITVTRDGKPGTAMVGWKTQLTEAEIAAVVDYVRTTFMREGPHAPARAASGTSAHAGREAAAAPAVSLDLPLPGGLKGDAARGKRFYDANCVACHGVRGDGQGPRAYFIRPKPRNFVDPAARAVLNRPALYAAIAAGRSGTDMPAWDKVIDPQTIADVAEYVFRGFLHPGPGSGAKRAP